MSTFIISLFCGIVYLVIGINAFNAQEQQSFWLNGKMPKVHDIKKWNRALGKLYCCFAIFLILIGIAFLMPLNVIVHGAVAFLFLGAGLAIMILVYYKYIVPKYQVK